MKKRTRISLMLVSAIFTMGMVSCSDDYEPYDAQAQFLKDSVIILNYIADHDLEASEVWSTGVFVSIYHQGSEDTLLHPTRYASTDTTYQYVTVGYKGMLTDGTVFDMTTDSNTVEFALTGVIDGWRIGIPEMTKGDSATILIPSGWAYGPNANGIIPANSVLVFDVYLESFERR